MAAANTFIYDTYKLIALVPNLKRPQKWLLDKFFPGVVNSDSEKVAIDVDVGKRRVAPFCSPLVEGKLVEQRRYQTNEFKPPYIKDKRIPDLLKPVRRMIGERIGGELTPVERMQANLEAELTDQIDGIDRRLEWMAANALASGTITVAGDGFPTTVIDFGRDSALTVALSSGVKWTAANIGSEASPGATSPVADIETWQTLVLKKSGAVMTDIVFTPGSWKAFMLDWRLKGAIIYPKFADQGNVINPGAQIQRGAVYKGRWGQYDLWLYNDWYVDDNNAEQPMLADGTVILSGPDLMGTRAFAQILDPDFSYASLSYAPKVWTQPDPAQRYLMMQSAPLVIPSRVNASFAATVI